VSEADLAKVGGKYTTPPDVARLVTLADRVLTF
jgi:hypothetical protein